MPDRTGVEQTLIEGVEGRNFSSEEVKGQVPELEKDNKRTGIFDGESRLISSEAISMYLFGVLPDSEQNLSVILGKLKEDKKIVRQKYGLPPEEMLKDNPREYEIRLRAIAKKLGVDIVPTTSCGRFFKENSAGGVFLSASDAGNKKIGVDIKKTSLDEYIKSLRVLEHEIIHALQAKRYPRMPIELQEYEAYVAGVNIKYLEENPEAIRYALLEFFLYASINTGYRLLNASRKDKGLPPVIPTALQRV